MAGPLRITMGVFGSLVSVLMTIGTIMLVSTGIAQEQYYQCSQVSTANIENFTNFSHFQVLVPSVMGPVKQGI